MKTTVVERPKPKYPHSTIIAGVENAREIAVRIRDSVLELTRLGLRRRKPLIEQFIGAILDGNTRAVTGFDERMVEIIELTLIDLDKRTRKCMALECYNKLQELGENVSEYRVWLMEQVQPRD